MIDLNKMREEFARFLSEDPTRFRMDAALAHVLRMAYQQGIEDAKSCPAVDLPLLAQAPS